MTDLLKPFDAEAKCPKCGGDNISATYHAAGASRPMDDCWNTVVEDVEHHDRYCRRCSYEWCEAPALTEKEMMEGK